MKKLISKIRRWLCYYHKKRYEKLFAKIVGAKKYYLRTKEDLSSIYGLMVYGDTDSVKNR